MRATSVTFSSPRSSDRGFSCFYSPGVGFLTVRAVAPHHCRIFGSRLRRVEGRGQQMPSPLPTPRRAHSHIQGVSVGVNLTGVGSRHVSGTSLRMSTMSPKTPSPHSNIGMPQSDRQSEVRQNAREQETQRLASRDKALEYATQLANRNAELMRRLA